MGNASLYAQTAQAQNTQAQNTQVQGAASSPSPQVFNAKPFARGSIARLDVSQAGSRAPALNFEGKNGKMVSLADFAGKVVLVNLWATWCAPCIKEMPALDRLARLNPDKLAVIAISQDMAGWRVVDPFFAKTKLSTLTPYIDKKNQLALHYKAKGLPLSIIYDAQGREVARLSAPTDWDRGEGLALLKALAKL
jgi:thiol-disulfide isomerase/thioredoxin